MFYKSVCLNAHSNGVQERGVKNIYKVFCANVSGPRGRGEALDKMNSALL